jgi:hypothetical protein
MNDAKNILHVTELLADNYEELAVESAHELEELVRLRSDLSWADWKAHPRFKRDRLIREAQRQMGVPGDSVPVIPVTAPANDTSENPTDTTMAELASDECFATMCDDRRDAWMAAMDDEEICD